MLHRNLFPCSTIYWILLEECLNMEEVHAVKPKVSMQTTKVLVMETPKVKKTLACHVQAKHAAKIALSTPETAPEVKTDVVIKKEKVEGNKEIEVIDDANSGERQCLSNNDVVSNIRKYTSSGNAKTCIQVFVSNLFHHRTDENMNVYAVMTNFHECIWYMKYDFIISCLVGMEKAPLMEYKLLVCLGLINLWISQFMLLNMVLTNRRRARPGKLWRWYCSLSLI